MRGRNYSLRTLHADATILDVSSAMRKLTTRQLESRLLRDASNHRCEITGVKFRAGLLNH